MKKNLSYLFVLFVLSFLLVPSVEAIKVKNTDILYNSYVIGTYLYTAPDNEIENTLNNKNAIYDGSALYTKEIMAGAITLGDTAYKDIKIYYKDFFDDWVDALTGSYFSAVEDEFEITHVNGICVDPVCDPESDNIIVTFVYNNGNDSTEKKVAYNNLVDEPTVPSKLGFNFTCWVDSSTNECYDFTKPVVKSLTLNADWETIEYKVTFVNTLVDESAQGSKHVYECNFASADKCSFQEFMFTLKDGYTFNGWSLAKSGEKVYKSTSNFDELFGTNPNITLYSIFNSDEYTISYNLGGGTFDTLVSPPTEFAPSELTYTLPTPKREGYTFLGWKSKNTDNAVVTDLVKLEIKKMANVELEATWKANEYDVYVDSTETKLNISKCVYDSICTLDLSKVAIKGKEITKAVALVNGKEVSIGTNVKNLSSVNNDKVQVKLTYADITYDINYELNGGTISGQTKTIKTGVEVTLVNPSKKGYTFDGWEVTKGADVITLANSKLSLKTNVTKEYENIVLTAKWNANKYDVIYDDIKLNKVACVYDEDCSLDFSKIEIPAGKVIKSVVASDGIKTYTIGPKVINLTVGNKIDVEVEFDDIDYTISYQYNGGIVTNANPASMVLGETITLNEPVKEGYDFNGWSIDGDYAFINNNVITLVDTSDVSLTANWKVKTFDVVYNANGGNATPTTHECTYDTCKISDDEIKKTGYQFAGWVDKATGYIYQPGAVVSNLAIENVTLEAKWLDEKPYTIKYNLNGGYFAGEHNVSYAKGTQPVLTTPKKDGYTFKDWTYKDNVKEGNIEVTANWQAIEYTVSFYLKNRVLATNTCTYGTECSTLASHERIVEEELIGWSYSNGGDLFYGLGVPSNYLCEYATVKDGYSCSLYAVTNDVFKISYNLNDGVIASSDKHLLVDYYNYGDVLVLPVPSKEGYLFTGWTSDANISVEVDENYYTYDLSLIGDVTFTANFVEAVNVSLNLNSGSFVDSTETTDKKVLYTGGVAKLEFPAVVREGYELVGWAVGDLNDLGNNTVYELLSVNNGDTVPVDSFLLDSDSIRGGYTYLEQSTQCTSTNCYYLVAKTSGTATIDDYYLDGYSFKDIVSVDGVLKYGTVYGASEVVELNSTFEGTVFTAIWAVATE